MANIGDAPSNAPIDTSYLNVFGSGSSNSLQFASAVGGTADVRAYRSAAGALTVDRPSSGTTTLGINSGAASQASYLRLNDSTTNKWSVRKESDNTFRIYDDVNGHGRFAVSTAGLVQVQPTAGRTMVGTSSDLGGVLGVNGDRDKTTRALYAVTNVNDISEVGGVNQGYRPFYFFGRYHGVETNPFAVGYHGLVSTVNVGEGATLPVGTLHALESNVVVYSNNHASSEYTAWRGIVNHAHTTAGHAATFSGIAGHTWLADLTASSAHTQSEIFSGVTILMQNHYNGSPSVSPSYGLAVTTRAASLDARTTYPMDIGIVIDGTSSSSALGFTTALQIGSVSSAWMTAGTPPSASLIGTGIDVRHYATNGIKIQRRTSGSTGASLSLSWDTSGNASTSQNDGIDFGGDISLYRGATSGRLQTQSNKQFGTGALIAFGTAGAGYLEFSSEQSSAPGALSNGARVYIDDSGGKTRLVCRFGTGAVQPIVTEP